MRLESLRGNWSRVRVGSRKVNRVYLKEKDVADLKLRYYDQMVQLALQDDDYLEACNAYQQVRDTEEIQADEAREINVLENIMTYAVLAPYNNEQSDMLHKLFADSALQKSPLYYDLVKCFVTKELMRWPGIEALYGQTLRRTPVFAPDSVLGKKTGQKAEGKKEEEIAQPGEARWQDLHKRVVEHVSFLSGALLCEFSLWCSALPRLLLGSLRGHTRTCRTRHSPHHWNYHTPAKKTRADNRTSGSSQNTTPASPSSA